MRVQENAVRPIVADFSEGRHRLHEGTKSNYSSTPSVEIPNRSSTTPMAATSVPNTTTRRKTPFGVGEVSSSLSRHISTEALEKPSTSVKSAAKFEDYDETKNPFSDDSTNPFGEDDDDYNDSLNPFSEWSHWIKVK